MNKIKQPIILLVIFFVFIYILSEFIKPIGTSLFITLPVSVIFVVCMIIREGQGNNWWRNDNKKDHGFQKEMYEQTENLREEMRKKIEVIWLKELEAFQKWQWGINKIQLKEVFSEVKFWEETHSILVSGKQYTLFGEPSTAKFIFTEDNKLNEVQIRWESPTSSAHVFSKFAHIQDILDKTYGKSEVSKNK
ncbi:MAG: hypothetical protein COS17_09620, partial [Elusimicrobia bacterium CG02_land_8_20_14_3_00_37_13]